ASAIDYCFLPSRRRQRLLAERPTARSALAVYFVTTLVRLDSLTIRRLKLRFLPVTVMAGGSLGQIVSGSRLEELTRRDMVLRGGRFLRAVGTDFSFEISSHRNLFIVAPDCRNIACTTGHSCCSCPRP